MKPGLPKIQQGQHLRWACGFFVLVLLWMPWRAVGVPGSGAASPAGLSDSLAGRVLLAGGSGTVIGSNRGATLESGEPRPGGRRGGHSVWVAFRSDSTGSLALSTERSSFDTVLAVYRVDSSVGAASVGFGSLSQVSARDDDDDGALTSTLTVGIRAGVEYAIVIDGYGGASGDVVLAWAFTPRTHESPSIISMTPSQSVVAGVDFTMSVVVGPGEGHEYAWYRGDSRVERGEGPSVLIRSFSKEDAGRYRVRVSSEGVVMYSDWIELQLNTEGPGVAVAADKLYDAVDAPLRAVLRTGRSGAATAGTRSTGGRLLAAIGVVRGLSGTQVFNTTTATHDPSEPQHCGQAGGASYWFAYEATESGVLHFDAAGTAFQAVLAVYSFTPPLESYSQMVAITCDVADPAHAAPTVTFGVEAGRTYAVVLDGVGGARGVAQLNYQFERPSPPDVAPSVAQEPGVVVVAEGRPWFLTVGVAGTAPFGFLWRHEGQVVADAHGARLESLAAVMSDAGAYVVEVTNRAGAATSIVARVTVGRPPVIVEPMPDRVIAEGGSTLLQSHVTGDGSMTFRWFKDGLLLPDDVGPVKSISHAVSSDAGAYRFEVASAFGVATGLVARVNVVPVPRGTLVLSSPRVAVGSDVVVGVRVDGATVGTVAWYHDSALVPGVFGVELRLASARLSDSGDYRAVASTDLGPVDCGVIALRVLEPVVFGGLPQAQLLAAGSPVLLAASAAGSPPLRWQWIKDGIALEGGTRDTFALPAAVEADSGMYSVTVANELGSVHCAPVRVGIVGPPRVLADPISARVAVGGQVCFSVKAEVGEGGKVVWFKDGVVLEGLSGLAAMVSDCSASSAGSYAVEVTNIAGSLRSSPARLEVVERSGMRWDPMTREIRLWVLVRSGGACRIECARDLGGPWELQEGVVGDATGLHEFVWVVDSLEGARYFRSVPVGAQALP